MTSSCRVGALLVLVCTSCKQPVSGPEEVDYGLVRVLGAKQRLTQGSVGTGRFESKASYLLVDAVNDAPEPLSVTLVGGLLDEKGNTVGTFAPQSLVVPAKGVRMFALVDSEAIERPDAVKATARVIGAARLKHRQDVRVTDGSVRIDEGRAVVLGEVENTAERGANAVVIAGFYDANGRPMKRPSTLFELAPGGKRGVQFVGPPGSKSAYLYLGEVVFP